MHAYPTLLRILKTFYNINKNTIVILKFILMISYIYSYLKEKRRLCVYWLFVFTLIITLKTKCYHYLYFYITVVSVYIVYLWWTGTYVLTYVLTQVVKMKRWHPRELLSFLYLEESFFPNGFNQWLEFCVLWVFWMTWKLKATKKRLKRKYIRRRIYILDFFTKNYFSYFFERHILWSNNTNYFFARRGLYNLITFISLRARVNQVDYVSFTPKIFFKQVYFQIFTIYNFFKSCLLALVLSSIYFFFTLFFFKLQFLKQISVWFILAMLFFWLISGFNFFVKKYRFGKFTSQVQRFWKRANACFWLVEGSLICIFVYYYLNSSQEPLYMFDYSSLNHEYLPNFYSIAFSTSLTAGLIFLMYFCLLRINCNSWSQLSLYLISISIFIFTFFFVESYQFYYVLNSFVDNVWTFSEEENLWILDSDAPTLRVKQQYLLVCLILKYWHFLFIFLTWVFFLIKSFEKKKVTYNLFSLNLQNFIFLFFLNWVCYVQLFKWVYRQFFDQSYFWFFITTDNKFLLTFFCETVLTICGLLNINDFINTLYVINKSLLIWAVDSLVIWKFIV